MSRLWRLIPIGVATTALAGVVVLYRWPERVFDTVPDAEAVILDADPGVLLLVTAGVLGFVAVLVVFRSRLWTPAPTLSESNLSYTRSSQSLFDDSSKTSGQLGEAFDETYATATNYGTTDRTRRETARTDVIDELRTVAATAYKLTEHCDDDTAREAVRTGEWTTNRRAAGLLAGEDGPSIPLTLWLWDLVVGRDPFANGVEHAISAMQTVYERTEPGGGR